MLNNHIGCLPVCNENRQVVGLITDRDITLRCVACDKDTKKTPVSEIMTSNVFCCNTDDEVYKAENQMAQNQVRRLPVTENGKIVGILTLGNLAQHNNSGLDTNVGKTFEYICKCHSNTKNAE